MLTTPPLDYVLAMAWPIAEPLSPTLFLAGLLAVDVADGALDVDLVMLVESTLRYAPVRERC